MAEAGIEAAAKKRCAAPGCDAVGKSAVMPVAPVLASLSSFIITPVEASEPRDK